jgi:hypothetical protein
MEQFFDPGTAERESVAFAKTHQGPRTRRRRFHLGSLPGQPVAEHYQVLVAFPTSIKLKSRLFSTCDQLIRICRIPDVMSLVDGLCHAAIQFRDRAMRSDQIQHSGAPRLSGRNSYLRITTQKYQEVRVTSGVKDQKNVRLMSRIK